MNQLATPSWTLKEVGRGYENNLKFVGKMKRVYDGQFDQRGAKVGDTINYRLPQRWTVSDGAALDVQALLDQTVPISLTNQKHIDMAWSCWQETTQIEEARQRYINPAADALASVIDALAIGNCYRDIYNAIGTPGTTPSTRLAYLQAQRKLFDLSVPEEDVVAVLDPEAALVLADQTMTLFNPSSDIAQNYKKGMLGRGQLGISEWYRDQNRPMFTTGSATAASTPLVNGASQTGSSVISDGWASGGTSLKKGDIFTIGGVYSVNPLSRVSTGRLQQFVVTSDISDTTGAITIPISPSIITSGALQTVNASPADDAVITYWSMAAGGTQSATASPTGMIFHPEAFAFVTADLANPAGGAKFTKIASGLRGVALRMAEQWDVKTDQNITRIDTIVGAATLQPRFACRVQG